jgi:hypothetical protein
MIRGIAEHGGESDYIKSADWQRMKEMQQAAVAELHEAYNIQSFRETTAEFFEKMATAGTDPTSFVRDASTALKQSNADLQAKINGRLRTEGYNGTPIKFTDLSQYSPSESLVKDKTSVQTADAATPGALTTWNPVGQQGPVAKTSRTISRAIGGDFSPEATAQERAENAGAQGPTGLSLADDRRVMSAIAIANGSKNPEAAASALDRLVDAASSPDDAIANAVIGRIRGESPELYKQLLTKLPPDRANALRAIDRDVENATLGGGR